MLPEMPKCLHYQLRNVGSKRTGGCVGYAGACSRFSIPDTSDLTDAEWALIEPVLPPRCSIGRPSVHSRCTLLNAIFYQLRSGGAWSLQPQVVRVTACRHSETHTWEGLPGVGVGKAVNACQSDNNAGWGNKVPDLPLASLIRSQQMDPYRGSCGRTCSWNLAS
jgi:hypothetical protein